MWKVEAFRKKRRDESLDWDVNLPGVTDADLVELVGELFVSQEEPVCNGGYDVTSEQAARLLRYVYGNTELLKIVDENRFNFQICSD